MGESPVTVAAQPATTPGPTTGSGDASGASGAAVRRVGVILGGRSSEREVSLASGRQVVYNLDRARFEAIPLFMDGNGRLWRLPAKLVVQNTCADVEARLAADAERVPLETLPGVIDIAFIALHGKYGDDGCIQGALELAGVPYTGSGVLAAALSLDKPMAHRLLAAHGFAVPREVVVAAGDWAADLDGCVARIAVQVGAPLVVLPVREGSSIGVGVVADIEDPAALVAAVDEALRWDTAALVEEFLDGLEFSVIVLGAPGGGAEALLPTETISPNPFMTYDDKYMPGRSQKITPARVGADTLARIRREAERIFVAFGFKGYARLDGFLMPDGRLLFTDPNSTSGMAPSSFMFHQAAEAGLTAGMVIERIIEVAAADHRAKRGPL
ncbi:MAG: hypothetical protein U0470_01095 [Anaerolineae bacterium]